VYTARLETMDRALRQHLDGRARWQRPDGGYFFWLEFDPGLDTAELRRRAGRFGVGFQPGEVFSCRRELNHCLRLSFAHYRRDDVERGVARLSRLLNTVSGC
jgi:DNA-binding transcriptional MocR family regulator